MREIKFRGFSIAKKKWVYGNYNYTFERGYISQGYDDVPPRCYYIDTETNYYEVYSQTVGQYTGLKDKNGKEIYEGDIITGGDGNVPTQILWVDEYGGWGAKNLKRNEIHALDKYFKRFIGEVIGNIHDNPELID